MIWEPFRVGKGSLLLDSSITYARAYKKGSKKIRKERKIRRKIKEKKGAVVLLRFELNRGVVPDVVQCPYQDISRWA